MSKFAIVSCITLGCLSASCVVETQVVPHVYSGTLVVDWTISSTKAPSACTQSQATSIAVDLVDAAGAFVDSDGARCGAFATSIVLPEGRYEAHVWLSDGSGAPRTTTLVLPALDIRAGTSLLAAIDFPPDSFL